MTVCLRGPETVKKQHHSVIKDLCLSFTEVKCSRKVNISTTVSNSSKSLLFLLLLFCVPEVK